MNSELDDCVVTFDQTKDELEDIERRLAKKLGIKKNIRRTLLEMNRSGSLVEDRLVADWHDAFSSYVDWTRDETWGIGPSIEPTPPKIIETNETLEAAQAASSLFAARQPDLSRYNGRPCHSISGRSGTSIASFLG